MRYPVCLTNTTNPLLSLFDCANEYTGDVYGVSVLLGLFVVLFFVFRRSGNSGIMVASILTLIAGFFMRVLGLISDSTLIWFFAGTVGIILYTYFSGE